MYCGLKHRFEIILTLLLIVCNKTANTHLTVSLKSWDTCDMGYTQDSPKICVMQRNIGDHIKLHPKLRLSDGETLRFSHWYRVIRIFPGDKTFETLLTKESAGSYMIKNAVLEVPSIKEIDMDKNRLKYSAMGSHGSTDEILFIIQQIPVEIRKYIGDSMLLDLSHFMTIPEAAPHFNWTYRHDLASPEITLPKDLQQKGHLLKGEAIKKRHRGLYICSFYGGHDGTMSFFVGEKIFHVTVHGQISQSPPHDKRSKLTSNSFLNNTISSRHVPVWESVERFDEKHARKSHHSSHLSSTYHKHPKHDKRRKSRVRFETHDDDDDDDEESGDDEEEEEEDHTTTLAPAQVVSAPPTVAPITQKPAEAPKPAPQAPVPIQHHFKPPTHPLPAPQPLPAVRHHHRPPMAPLPAARDYAPMPGQTIPPFKSSSKIKEEGTPFGAWLKNYQTHIKEEIQALHGTNGSLMDFAGTFEADAVRYVQSGGEAILPCAGRVADGTLDKSKVVWKRVKPLAGVLSDSTDRYEVLGSGDLKILRSVAEDSGEYACEVDGKASSGSVPLSVFLNPLPRTFVTIKFSSSTCKAYLLEKVTHDFVSKMGPHVCPDDKCAMATPVMQCHMSVQNPTVTTNKATGDTAGLTLSFNFKLGANFKATSQEQMFKDIKEIYDKAASFIQREGQIYKPDIFEGRFGPMMDTIQMNSFAYCPPGFGIKGQAGDDSPGSYKCLTCAPGYYNGHEKPVCAACNFTQFQSKPAATSCETCPGSTKVAVQGATSADACEDPIMGVVKHNIYIIAGAVVGVLFVAIGTYLLVKRRLAQKDVQAKMAGLEREKRASEARALDPGKFFPAYDPMNFPVMTPSQQALQSNIYYNPDGTLKAITPSQLALHPSYTQLPPNAQQHPMATTSHQGIPPSGQISIVLNNQAPPTIPPPPAPAVPTVQQHNAPAFAQQSPYPLRPAPAQRSSTMLPRIPQNSFARGPPAMAGPYHRPVYSNTRLGMPQGVRRSYTALPMQAPVQRMPQIYYVSAPNSLPQGHYMEGHTSAVPGVPRPLL